MPSAPYDPITPGAPRSGLRARLREALLAEVSAAALQLFFDRGFEQTTIDDITATAGISRSTFFRCFPTKEDVVLGHLDDIGQRNLEALRARPASEPLWTALRQSLSPTVEQTGGPGGPGLRMARLLADTPSLRARHHEKVSTWQFLFVPEVARRLDLMNTPGDPRPSALVLAALSCVDAATDAWIACDGATELHELIAAAMNSVGSAVSKP